MDSETPEQIEQNRELSSRGLTIVCVYAVGTASGLIGWHDFATGMILMGIILSCVTLWRVNRLHHSDV